MFTASVERSLIELMIYCKLTKQKRSTRKCLVGCLENGSYLCSDQVKIQVMNERYQHSWRTLQATALTQDLSCSFLSSTDFWFAHLNLGVSDLLSSHASDRYGLRVLSLSFSFAAIFC
ncbi:hypothetical protein DsansV1_C11g0110271 [Dioscorea sansibarensis]